MADTGSRASETGTTVAIPPSARIAVLMPCRNEAVAVAAVVGDFRASLPGAIVHVYDNASTDQTATVAARAGARVTREERIGKGHVVRRMFADIEADAYVLVDGDGTYDAASAARMVALLLNDGLDMVVGVRQGSAGGTYRPGHRAGNRLLTGFVGWLFGRRFSDMLSGYRVFSRRFVKSFPALASGFETETELTVHALQLRMPVAEVPTPYRARPEGSVSKLSTLGDGGRIVRQILSLYQHERPLMFFGAVAALLASTSIVLAIPIVLEWLATGLVPRFPTAILSTGLMILASLSLASGVILQTVTRGRLEFKRLAYLLVPRFESPT
jgi:hypothetical protein